VTLAIAPVDRERSRIMAAHQYRLIVVLSAAAMMLSMVGLTLTPQPTIHAGHAMAVQLEQAAAGQR
jgi:hypothetical protein